MYGSVYSGISSLRMYVTSSWNIGTEFEVFTVPPYSTWNPCGIHIIPGGFHPFHMEYVLGEIPAILVIPFHLYSTWNTMNSTWIPPFHME